MPKEELARFKAKNDALAKLNKMNNKDYDAITKLNVIQRPLTSMKTLQRGHLIYLSTQKTSDPMIISRFSVPKRAMIRATSTFLVKKIPVCGLPKSPLCTIKATHLSLEP